MGHRSADNIIDSIVHVTGHSDRDRLESSLITTLYELTQADQVCLYKLVRNLGDWEVHKIIEITDDNVQVQDISIETRVDDLKALPVFKHCYINKTVFSPEHPDQAAGTWLYPILNSHDAVVGFVELNCADLDDSGNKLVGGFLRIYRNYLRLMDESESDMLTGLLNRRTFDRNIGRFLYECRTIYEPANERAAHKRRAFDEGARHWLAVLDIDHFKKINDTFGHLYGDEVLILFANIMRMSFRAYDKLFRFGGEEFLVLIKTHDYQGVVSALERFRKAVADYTFPQVGRVTVSVGFVSISEQDVPGHVLGLADTALYYAKAHGRNQVCCYEQLLEAGQVTTIAKSGDIELF